MNKEGLHSKHKYAALSHGGRIKTAGASLDPVYEAALPIIQDPNQIEAAYVANRNFAALRNNPPIEVRNAFFPQDTRSMKMAFAGAGIYRPTLKTDQGPAGNFAPFYISGGESALEGKIISEQGVAVMEEFLTRRLKGASLTENESSLVRRLTHEVQAGYASGDYKATHDSIMSIRAFGGERGIETTRRAGVGRTEFFFCRPVGLERDIRVGEGLRIEVERKTAEVIERVEFLAETAKRLVRKGIPIAEAVELAQEGYQQGPILEGQPKLLYFQPDVLVRSDGTIDIERINFPDLGMFIAEITPNPSNALLRSVQDVNEGIRRDIAEQVIGSVGSPSITLVTREEVLGNAEDTLEHLELKSFSRELSGYGKVVSIRSLKDVLEDSDGHVDPILLMNISPSTPEYEALLQNYASGHIECYPDPFVKLFEADATTYHRNIIREPILGKFLDIIKPTAMDKPKGIYEKGKLIDQALRRGGTEGDIIYFNLPGMNGQQIPTFRYDPRSFFEVAKAVSKMKENGGEVDRLTATSIPFSPEDAVMHGVDGPRMSVFRFMFVRS